jgi:mono/diheme cytochrome c family protein
VATWINEGAARRPHGEFMVGNGLFRSCIGGVAWTLLWAVSSPTHAESDIARGEALVRTNCSPCHAVGSAGKSPHPDAPAFRTLSERYPIEDLAEALAEGISTGHPDMPEFVASPDQIDAIIAYIGSLQHK